MAKIAVIFDRLRRFERAGFAEAVLPPRDWVRLAKVHDTGGGSGSGQSVGSSTWTTTCHLN